jgi:hypothetical protein
MNKLQEIAADVEATKLQVRQLCKNANGTPEALHAKQRWSDANQAAQTDTSDANVARVRSSPDLTRSVTFKGS